MGNRSGCGALKRMEKTMFELASPSDLPAFKIGHAQDEAAGTGCTVVVAPQGATCGVDVRGGGPATRETDLLKPQNMIESIHAVVLAGGSAFGLEASCGVMDELASRSIGFSLGSAVVPIVVGACLFDLLVGEPSHPDKAMGQRAAQAAFHGGDLAKARGNVGAGTGATVGKMGAPEKAMKSGFGWFGLRMGELVAVALVAVNALGQIQSTKGEWIAGLRDEKNKVLTPQQAMAAAALLATQGASAGQPSSQLCENTTLGIVLTNGALTKAQATKVASMVHDAYARCIKPVHTSNDGDTIFCLASGEVPASVDMAGMLAEEAMEHAIEAAVTSAQGAYGLPAQRDLVS